MASPSAGLFLAKLKLADLVVVGLGGRAREEVVDPLTAMAAWSASLAGIGALVWAAGRAGRIAEVDDSEDH